MSPTLQIEEAVQLHDAPKLLIEWPSRWDEFVTSIGPAFSKSTARLAGEAPHGGLPFRGMLMTWAVEAFLLFVIIIIPVKLAKLRPYVAPKLSRDEILYYSGDELPRTNDLGGTQAGKTGRAGGQEAHHRTQTIKIARGGSLVERMVDAPNVKLPPSRDAVANLLTIKPNPGPPPLEGARSTRAIPNSTEIVAPAPTISRDRSRSAPTLGAVIQPVPGLARDKSRSAPEMNSDVIAPAPKVARDHPLIAPVLNSGIVAPAPRVSRDRSRSTPSLSAEVIAPASGSVSRELSRAPVQMTNAIVPPPVSAPERASLRNPKLTLPAPNVIAPPPSADMSQDMRRLASGNSSDPTKTVVPPPPTPTGSGSFMSNMIGKIFGTTDVVPPPPAVSNDNNSESRSRSGIATSANVVPPPPSMSQSGGGRSSSGSGAGTLGAANVVPPPPSLSDKSGTSRGTGAASGDSGRGTQLANNIVPPPPSIGGGSGLSGSGRGAKGQGLGGLLDAGSVLAPANGGSGANSGAVISAQPGSKVGMPSNGGAGALALSPAGGDKPGVGGSGGGSGIGHGKDSGSGMTGENSGAAKSGTGRGSDTNARGGISPSAGPGGAGNAPAGNPAVPGVSVTGGSTIVTLPSFGSDGGSGPPSLPGRSSATAPQTLGVTVVSTSGGAFESYKKMLPGEKYTTYFDTSLGKVPMEFSDAASAGHPYGGSLVSPQAMRTDLPAGLPHVRLVIACILDASGNLKDLRILESGPADMNQKVLAALHSWKFQPAMRNGQPVEINAILGFNIDTNDRF